MTTPNTSEHSQGSWTSSLLIIAAFSLFSPLSLLAVNAPRDAPPGKFLLVASVAFAVAGGLAVMVARWLGRRRATALASACLLVFFSWSILREAGRRFPADLGASVALGVLVLMAWAAWRFGRSPAYQRFLAAVGVGLMAAPLPALFTWYAGDRVVIEVAPAITAEARTPSPDVFFIVLDGYGRADILEEFYGFSNREFIEELERRGFQVPVHSRANYSATASSISSLLAMDHLVERGQTPDHRLVQALHDVIGGDNPVVGTLKASGYHYVHIESGWDGARCGEQVDSCYEAAFLDEAMWTLVGRTPLAPLAAERYGHAFSLNGLRSLDALHREATTDRQQPRMVFGHVLIPHPPLPLNAACGVRPEPQPAGPAVGARFLLGTSELDDRRAAYVEQVECANARLLRFLDEVDEDALVFITGDHGPDSFGQLKFHPSEWTEHDIRERFSVFSAYRLPAQCRPAIVPDIDLINGMRAVLGCAVGTELAPRDSRSFIFPLADGPPHPVTEIDIEVLGG